MINFIELTKQDGTKLMVNTLWIDSVSKYENGCLITMRFDGKEVVRTFRPKESYKEVKALLAGGGDKI